MPNEQPKITDVVIRMYKMGTGDFFTVKFMAGDQVSFKMMIDCGRYCFNCENQAKPAMLKYIKKMIEDMGPEIDLLVVTHEHTDHVVGFKVGESIFTNHSKFRAKQIWMAWSEKDGDPTVETWKKDHGKKKKNLALAAERIKKTVFDSKNFRNQLKNSLHAQEIIGLREHFSLALSEFANLNAASATYVSGLPGMEVVKNGIANNNIQYPNRGDVKQGLPGLPGVRIYVLGPPEVWKDVKLEEGEDGEAYRHNKDISESDLFFQAIEAQEDPDLNAMLCPFDEIYIADKKTEKELYGTDPEDWRRIDYDWLFSAGDFALRLTKGINNLSLVLAFEFIDSGKILLFPGDAEIGSWKSWHEINWVEKGYNTSTKNLLNNVVFYKVAHHLSHNGTAKSLGLDLMTHPDLAAMATLDYGIIDGGWKSTMPNRLIVHDLLEKTKGKLMIMNEEGLFYDTHNSVKLSDKITEYQAQMSSTERAEFQGAYKNESDFIEYRLKI